MNIWKISAKNIRAKPLSSALNCIVLALSIALLIGILQLNKIFTNQIEKSINGIDMVIGAKGSPLQLVLASVLHIENPTGNISYKEAMKIGRHPWIKKAIPISYGDNYKGYRIIGSTDQFAAIYSAKLKEGRAIQKPMEVIIGSDVANHLQLQTGDSFFSTHGLMDNQEDIHESNPMTVVGIYKPTKNTIDRLVITNLETIWKTHEHADNHQHESDQISKENDLHNEITSLLITFRNPQAMLMMPRNINKNTKFQAVLPKFELNRLHQFTGVGIQIISWIAYSILLLSGISILISLFKIIRERTHELALLRTYGATRAQLTLLITYESVFIGILSFILGIILSIIGLQFIFKSIQNQYKQVLETLQLFNDLVYIGSLLFVLISISISLVIYPILKMNISKTLRNEI